MTDQLDLFATPACEPPAIAEVIPFPCAHRTGKARHAARKILNKQTDKARDAYWADLIAKMAAKMRREGVCEDRIEAEINDFYCLVQGLRDADASSSTGR